MIHSRKELFSSLIKMEDEALALVQLAKDSTSLAMEEAKKEADKYLQDVKAKKSSLKQSFEREFIDEAKKADEEFLRRIQDEKARLKAASEAKKSAVLKLLYEELIMKS